MMRREIGVGERKRENKTPMTHVPQLRVRAAASVMARGIRTSSHHRRRLLQNPPGAQRKNNNTFTVISTAVETILTENPGPISVRTLENLYVLLAQRRTPSEVNRVHSNNIETCSNLITTKSDTSSNTDTNTSTKNISIIIVNSSSGSSCCNTRTHTCVRAPAAARGARSSAATRWSWFALAKGGSA